VLKERTVNDGFFLINIANSDSLIYSM
jgi:hypothetical protein